MKTFSIALRATIVTLVVTGLIYPFVMTGLAQMLFPWRANGSLVTDEKGQVVGSELIAQGFANPAYFQPRPSAAGEKGYDATSSGGSNFGPTSKKLQDRINDDLKRLKAENPEATGADSRPSLSPLRPADSIPIFRLKRCCGRCRELRKHAASASSV